MATTVVLNTLDLSVAEEVDDKTTSIDDAPNSLLSIMGRDRLIRRVVPFEVHDSVGCSEIVSLQTFPNAAPSLELSLWRTVLVITTLAGLAFANSMSVGLITICLPAIAADLHLAESLLLW